MKRDLRSIIYRYGLSVILFIGILAIALMLNSFEFTINLTIILVSACLVTAWFGGRGPDILVCILVVATMAAMSLIPADMVFVGTFILLVLIVVLVSGRKAVENRLRRECDLLRITLSSIGDAVITTDAAGRITFINSTAERLSGWNATNAQGKLLDQIYKVVDEDSGKVVRGIFGEILDKREIIAFDRNVELVSNKGLHVPIGDTAAPIIDSAGNFLGAVIVFQDVSERKEQEQTLVANEARAQQSQKLEAVGTLTGGIAHDFNNLLTAILGYTQLSIQELGDTHRVRENLVTIELAATRGAELTKKLLAFSKRQILDRRVINLNESISEILKLLQRVIGENIMVSFSAASDLRTVSADPAQVEQVIMNLSLNARDAMPQGGRLMIKTENVELDEYYCRQYPYSYPGKYAQILVSDTGVGMDTETVERIFEPFFTTKESGKGSGLGLSMVYGIIKQHGGHINVYSELAHGTTFKIFLPVVDSEPQTKPAPFQPSLLGGTETILVAEDEESLRKLSLEVLTALGYKVLMAKNGLEAVQLFAENASAIDLLLFDVVMPEMGGAEAYHLIREAGGGKIPLILTTGYSTEVLDDPHIKQDKVLDLAGVRVVQKPYTLDGLGRAVREVLDVYEA